MDFKLVLGILGNATAVALFASPLPTFWKIYKNRSTQDFSGTPYVCTLVNCVLWVLYGLPLVQHGALLVLTINVAGCAFEIFYLILFLTYSPKMERNGVHQQGFQVFQRKVAKVLAACCVAYAVVAALSLSVVPHKSRKMEVGSLCVVFTLAMYVSPLSVMRLVIKTRSVEFMPLLLCIFVFLNSTVWTGYGIIARDIFIIIPNGLGMLAGVLQLSLHVVYRNATPRQHGSGDPPAKAAGGDISMQAVYVPIEKDGKPNQSNLPGKTTNVPV